MSSLKDLIRSLIRAGSGDALFTVNMYTNTGFLLRAVGSVLRVFIKNAFSGIE